jgi:hypothetical protein
LGPAGQRSIRGVKARPEAVAEAAQAGFRVGAQGVAVEHQRRLAGPLGDLVEELLEQGEAQILGLRALAAGGVAGHHAGGVADEEDVPAGAHPGPGKAGDHVLRHVLLVEDRPAAGGGAAAGGGHVVALALVGGEDLLAHRMVEAVASR